MIYKFSRSIPFSLLIFGLVPSPVFFSMLWCMHDVGPEESASDDKPEGPAADDKLPATDDNPGDQEQMTSLIS